MNAFCTLDLW